VFLGLFVMYEANKETGLFRREVHVNAWTRNGVRALLLLAAALVIGTRVWQGLAAGGKPNPTAPHTSAPTAVLNIGVLVFREGLECILVLSAVTASMVGKQLVHRRRVMFGAGIGFLATLLTWFVAVGIVSDLSGSVSALDLQAATGLLAVVVLLVIMNCFFHKIYWGGWMSLHSRRKKALLADAATPEVSQPSLLIGLALLGFTSFYREGFEVVLFLQSYYLRLGGHAVLEGTMVGLFLTGIVAMLTFVAHRKLPYRKMLVLTGILLGCVLLVMVGEQAQEMQLAHWIPTTPIKSLELPPWLGLWFSIFPTAETLGAQALAAILVVGSFFLARRATSDSPNACRDEASVLLGHAEGCPLANLTAADPLSRNCPQCGMRLVKKL
jgi:high-affinity iron transporter